MSLFSACSFFPKVAGRVAEERGAVLGHEVGYCIRFDDCTDPLATRIKVKCSHCFCCCKPGRKLFGGELKTCNITAKWDPDTRAESVWNHPVLREFSLWGGVELSQRVLESWPRRDLERKVEPLVLQMKSLRAREVEWLAWRMWPLVIEPRLKAALSYMYFIVFPPIHIAVRIQKLACKRLKNRDKAV